MARSKRSIGEQRTAWLDESGHEAAGHATVLLAAVEVARSRESALVAAMRACVRGPGGNLHWRDEHPAQRRLLLDILNEHELTTWIALESHVPLRQKEAARARCLAAVLDLIDADGVTDLVIEGRPGGDHRDLQTIQRSRAEIELVRFGSKREPLLWAADIVASVRAGGAAFIGGDHVRWSQLLRTRTEHIRRFRP